MTPNETPRATRRPLAATRINDRPGFDRADVPGLTMAPEPDLVEKTWREVANEVMLRDGRRCRLCTGKKRLTVHHITPREHGGTEDARNLITLCSTCHDKVEGKSWKSMVDRLTAQLPNPPDIPRTKREKFVLQVATLYDLNGSHWGTNGETGGCWGVDGKGIVTFVSVGTLND